MHDFAALVGSVRHRGRSIAAIIQEHMSKRAGVLFLSFVYLALIYIIVAFTDITARAFVTTSSCRAAQVGAWRRRGDRVDALPGDRRDAWASRSVTCACRCGSPRRSSCRWSVVAIWLSQHIPIELPTLQLPLLGPGAGVGLPDPRSTAASPRWCRSGPCCNRAATSVAFSCTG
jgi:hypothetical protein